MQSRRGILSSGNLRAGIPDVKDSGLGRLTHAQAEKPEGFRSQAERQPLVGLGLLFLLPG